MKILRYHHNKLDHKGVIHHGLLLSLQSDLSVVEILSLPLNERNYLEGQSGKYLKAPMNLYPMSSPLSSSEVTSLGQVANSVNVDKLQGSGSEIRIGAGYVRAEVSTVEVHNPLGSISGYCILINWFDAESKNVASVLGPWITSADEIASDTEIDLKVSVNGRPGNLNELRVGDYLLVDSEQLGSVSNTVVSS